MDYLMGTKCGVFRYVGYYEPLHVGSNVIAHSMQA